MEQPPALSQLPPEASSVPEMSLTGRIFNVLATPSDVFDSVKAAPPSTANWLTPALILIFVSWLGVAVIFSQDAIKHQLTELSEKPIQEQIQKGRMSKEQGEKALEIAEKYGGIWITILSYVGPAAIAFVSPFWWAFLIWLIGVKFLKADFPFMKAVEVAGLANMIVVLDAIVRSLLILAMGNLYVSPSLALLLKNYNPQNPVHTLAGLANVMTFWALGVRAIGLARLANVSAVKAAAWLFGTWAGYTSLLWGLGAAAQMLVKKTTGS